MLFNLTIRGFPMSSKRIHILYRHLHTQLSCRYIDSLGKKDYRLDTVFVEQHLATVVNVIIYAEFKYNSLQEAAIYLSINYLCY